MEVGGASRPGRGPTREELLAEVARLRRTIEEQREAFDLFRVLAEEAPGMIFLLDLAEGRLSYVNRRYAEALGLAPGEATRPGFDFFSLIAPESVDAVRRSHGTHLRGEDHLPFEYTMLARDGRRLEVILTSRVVEHRGRRVVVGVITDITSQHRMSEELRVAAADAHRERARAESVIAALGDGIIVQDRQWAILYQNEVSKGMFGDRRGEQCYRVFANLEEVCPWCPVVATYRDGGVHRHLLRDVPTPSGPRHFQLVSSPLLDADGQIVAGLKLVHDATALIETEEALRRATAELERQNAELRALDRLKDGLVRDVSHELKTPVAKQAMQVEILRSLLGPGCDGRVERALQVMAESLRRQQRVIRNLLDLARLESGRQSFRIEPVPLGAVVQRVLDDCRPALEAVAGALEHRVEPVAALADAEMLWHVVSNLVANAVKFASRGGAPRVRVTGAREGDTVVLRVTDNGVGLSAEELGRAFDRFYRADPSIEGSGVGLCLCRALLEGMNGSISLASPGHGHGATATVTLPLAP